MTTKGLPGQNCMNRARPVQTAHHKSYLIRIHASYFRLARRLSHTSRLKGQDVMRHHTAVLRERECVWA